jgi:hypothetical protein
VPGGQPAGLAEAGLAATCRHAPPIPDVTVQVVVTDGGRDVAAWWLSTGPSAVEGAVGRHPSPVVAVTLSVGDLRLVVSGELSVAVGYMRGDIKIEGPPGPVLAMVAWTASDAFSAWRSEVADALPT